MDSIMNDLPCRECTFPLRLVFRFEETYTRSLLWLRHFLERLGRDHTLAVWRDTFQDYDAELLMQILDTGWEETLESQAEEMEERITEFVATQFPVPVQGVSGKEAREIIVCMPPLKQIRERFPTLDVRRVIFPRESGYGNKRDPGLWYNTFSEGYDDKRKKTVQPRIQAGRSPAPGDERQERLPA